YDWPAQLQEAQWLHVSGVSPPLGPHVSAATMAAARAARQAGVRVSFDGKFRPRLWQRLGGDAQAVLRDLLAQAESVFADFSEMEVVLGTRFTLTDLMERIDAAAAA
ncbi:PfkB family carbohydrate kinase, partial [Stenotrophomonas maltophilia]|nr:PfkB family carbohydrate kinase [Stenotrophomonas maltophilia]